MPPHAVRFWGAPGERANYVGPDGKVDKRSDGGVVCRLIDKELQCEFKVRYDEPRTVLAELAIAV